MIRILAFGGETDVVGKGFIVDKRVESVDDLKVRLCNAFGHKEVREILFRGRGGALVTVDDVSFLRDNDVVIAKDSEHRPPLRSEKSSMVRLNVGGQCFITSRSTWEMKAPDSMVCRMLAAEASGVLSAGSRDESGSIVIDRSPKYFEPLLNYLRSGKIILDPGINPEGVYEEAKFFGIDELLAPLSALVTESQTSADDKPLSRWKIIDIISSTPAARELRLQGVNLAGANLSKLDLRNINFKYANMKGCILLGANLSFANLERADMSNAVLDGAQLLGTKMLCANLESASMRGCNFDDPAGSTTNMEGVNLKNAIMEGSNMARVNLRVATIKNGDLKNCDLRGAILAGADLELCDLSGSDLGEANLRGANLKDTTLELMQTPLHMSQTIR